MYYFSEKQIKFIIQALSIFSNRFEWWNPSNLEKLKNTVNNYIFLISFHSLIISIPFELFYEASFHEN